MDLNRANSLLALSKTFPMIMVILSGYATDRFGPRQTMTCSLLLTGILTVLLGIVPDSWTVSLVLIQAMMGGCFFPAGFSCLSSISPAVASSTVISFTVPLAYLIGCGAVPTMIGATGNAGSFALGITLVGILIITGGILSHFLKLPDTFKIAGARES
jgi:NNP family nitrate/nitrite transporter-like MFS transporter